MGVTTVHTPYRRKIELKRNWWSSGNRVAHIGRTDGGWERWRPQSLGANRSKWVKTPILRSLLQTTKNLHLSHYLSIYYDNNTYQKMGDKGCGMSYDQHHRLHVGTIEHGSKWCHKYLSTPQCQEWFTKLAPWIPMWHHFCKRWIKSS